jgi:hypothetical protein
MPLHLIEPPITRADLFEIPTVLEVADHYDCPQIPIGRLVIFVDGPELNDLIKEMLPFSLDLEFITWSFDPKNSQ